MTTDPTPPGRSTVAPVIDYEPPARAAAPRRLVQTLTSRPSARSSRGHSPGMRPDRPTRARLPPPLHSAAVFADAALRRILEVVDGRRPATHLNPLLTAGLAESVLSVRPVATLARGGPATLQRVRVQQVGSGGSASLDEGEAKLGPPHEPGEPATAVEAFGTYRRGGRTHALACRIERVMGTGDSTAWQIVALHIG